MKRQIMKYYHTHFPTHMPKQRKLSAYFFLGVCGKKFPTINEGLVRLLAHTLQITARQNLHVMGISTNCEREATLYLWILGRKIRVLQ